jgi:hypothetical protein
MKRKLLRLGLLAGASAACFVVYLWWTVPRHQINQAIADKIKPGMTDTEVVALTRVPPGNYLIRGIDGKTLAVHAQPLREQIMIENMIMLGLREKLHKEDVTYAEWLCDTGILGILFDKNAKVVCSFYEEYPETVWERCRRWLGIR